MSDNLKNNKRIAKNTLVLYLRMFFIMIVNLYSSRVVLDALGVEDYGIYNAVGGFVAMFALVSNSLTSAIMRFFTFELGKGDKNRVAKVFCTSVNVMLALSFILVLIGELFGPWFIESKMTIPPERLKAAYWVFQCSLAVFVLGVVNIPYNSVIVAHEHMTLFAVVSSIDFVLRLLVALSLYISLYDRLITYSVLLLFVSLLIRAFYWIYCKRKYEEATYHLYYEKTLLKQMTSFAGWNVLGQGAGLLNVQGVNVLMNIFFGVTINAARGIATQVSHAIQQLVSSFMTALNPQITKSYALGNLDYMHQLIFRGARFSYYLMLLFAVPLIFETPIILRIWLKSYPEWTVAFVQWTVVTMMINMLSNTLITGLHATGRIRTYMIVVGTVEFMCFPITYIAFKIGFSPLSAYYVYAAVYIVLVFLRLHLIKVLIQIKAYDFITNVLLKVILVSMLSIIVPAIVFLSLEESFYRLIILTCASSMSIAVCVFTIGMEENERKRTINVIRNKLIKI